MIQGFFKRLHFFLFSLRTFVFVMRALSFVLAVFISFLVLHPCGDIDVHTHDEKSAQVEDTHSHNSNAQDDCSAFCICSCCGISMELATIFFYNAVTVEKEHASSNFKHVSFYKGCFSDVSWEPPIV